MQNRNNYDNYNKNKDNEKINYKKNNKKDNDTINSNSFNLIRIHVVMVMCLILTVLGTGGCGMHETSGEAEVVAQLQGSLDDSENLESESAAVTAEYSQETMTYIYVYVCGAVNNEGVYSVPEKSRLFEVIEEAGGLKQDADRTSLNLAREVIDGEQIIILTEQEAAEQKKIAQQKAEQIGMVNINTATAQELTTISGIGESRAQAIISYREKNGKFSSVEDIKKVDGIKDGLFAKIKDKITV